MIPVSVTITYLLMTVTSFTPDSQVTTRNLYIPFPSGTDCQNALDGMRIGHSIGEAADSAFCISANVSDVMDHSKAWGAHDLQIRAVSAPR